MLDLAKHIVEQKSGHFEPDKFEDHYEKALQDLLEKKQKGLPIVSRRKDAPSNVVNLMDALRASISGGKSSAKVVVAKPGKKVVRPRRKAS
jgi:DNA end-binding protein Ku